MLTKGSPGVRLGAQAPSLPSPHSWPRSSCAVRPADRRLQVRGQAGPDDIRLLVFLSSCIPESGRSMGSKWRTEAAGALAGQVGGLAGPGGPQILSPGMHPSSQQPCLGEKSEGEGHPCCQSRSGASGGIWAKGSMSREGPAPSAERAPVRPGALAAAARSDGAGSSHP